LTGFLKIYPPDIGRPELSPGSDDSELLRLSTPGRYTDEWGSIWQIAEPGVVGEVKQPVLSDWAMLDGFMPPWDLIRRRDLSHVNRMCDKSSRFMLSSVSARPFRTPSIPAGTEMFLSISPKIINKSGNSSR